MCQGFVLVENILKRLHFIPFPHTEDFWMHLQQMTFENIVAKDQIAHNEQFLPSTPCFQLYSIIKLSFIPLPHIDAF